MLARGENISVLYENICRILDLPREIVILGELKNGEFIEVTELPVRKTCLQLRSKYLRLNFPVITSFEENKYIQFSLAYRLCELKMKIEEVFYLCSDDMLINLSYSKTKDGIRNIIDVEEPNKRFYMLEEFNDESFLFIEFSGWPIFID